LAIIKTNKKTSQVILVFPTKNENSTIEACINSAKESDYNPEIIVSDGYSNDNTREIAVNLGVEIVYPKKRFPGGKGAAIQAGLEYAIRKNGNIIILLDSDILNLTPDWVDNLIEPLISEDYNITRGVFFESSKDAALSHALAKPLLNTFFPEISDIRQPLGGEIAANRNTWLNLLGNEPPLGWGINLWFLIEATMKQFKVKEVLLGYKEHKSSLNFAENINLLRNKGEQISLTILNEAIIYNRMKNAQKILI
jgi:glucosyl-3-phosphoglycerate synthase